MKIKKLTIYGFKSFVDKVNLNFSAGTSGIIGPNGCGKSNVVDAIRWVIGEQNPRHLRGKSMEDIIFNGSDTRKPLGMAEVVLTFSNENGTAPARFANFTEIEIARRLYRSGESEYYINKVQCRLRDIADLFTDTGIGTRAYSIVEQGQVSWLISAKPEERRVIFEEAAGINKFKHKKEAALRRLEATRENLTRVNDIISEVKRQLNSLNRQAKKAERYKALKEEFRSVDMKLSALELRRLTDGLNDNINKLEGIKDKEAAGNAAIALKEARSVEIKEEYLRLESEFKTVKDRAAELDKTIQNLERESALSSARAEELKRNEQRLIDDIADLGRSHEAITSEISSLEASIRAADEHIAAESAKAAGLTSSLDEVMKELKEKEALQSAEKAGTLGVITRLSDIRHALQAHIKDEEHCRVRQARAAAEKEEHARTLASKQEPVRVLGEKIEACGMEKTSLEAELHSIRASLEAMELNKGEMENESKALKNEYANASARLNTLEEMERNFENVKGGARAIMLKGDRAGIHGLLADVIEANHGYEKAVEAVMGDRLQYVLVESHKEGLEAVEYLKAKSAGRGSFIPVRDTRPLNSPVPADAGAYSYPGAKELLGEVRIKDAFKNIVNYLLADTIVVDNLSAALELWRSEGIYKTIVTLEGEVLDPQGVITGGSAGGTDGGILQRRGEIKDIKGAVASLDERVRSLDGRIVDATAGITNTKKLLEECRDRNHAAEIARVNLEAELKRHTEEVRRLTDSIQGFSTEIQDAAGRLNEIYSKKTQLSAERDSLEETLAGREKLISELSAAITALTAKKEAVSGALTEVRVSLARSKERRESISRQLKDKLQSIENIRSRTAAKTSEIENGKGEISAKLSSVEALRERISVHLAEMDGIKKEEVRRSEELSALARQIKETDDGLKTLKSDLFELQELKGELTMEVKETELNIRHLRDTIIEKYGTGAQETSAHEPADGEDASTGQTGPEALEASKEELREKIASLGEVSLSALEEYNELEGRHQFLLEQQSDLTKSVDALHGAITRINRTTRERFQSAFDEINEKFKVNFPKFFNGGRAELRLTEEGDVLDAGIEIVAQPPGKRLQTIGLLSGGEKALTAVSLIFSVFLIKPSPFCLLDEVDAPLDDANIDRFNGFVKEMSEITQFLLITHSKRTMEMADALYGVTMEEAGVSKVLSVRF